MSTSVTNTGGRTTMTTGKKKSSSISALESFEQISTPWKETSDKPTANDRTSTKNLTTTRKAVSTSRKTTKTTTITTTGDPCGVTLGPHNSYLQDNLDIVRQKCREFHACTVELYKSENLHRILAGDNIQLRNICGLLYQNVSGDSISNNQCSSREKDSIKELLSEELSSHLKEKVTKKRIWEKFRTCFDKTPDENTYLDKLCRSKVNSTLPLCNDTDVQTTTETFLNDKFREYNYRCNCKTDNNLTASSLPSRALIGGVCGGVMILLLIVIIIVLCVRQRKLKHRLTKRTGNTTAPNQQFLSFPAGDQTSLSDSAGRLPETRRNNPRHRPAGPPPRVPERYVPYQLPATTSPNDQEHLEQLPVVYSCQELPEGRGSGRFSDQHSLQDNPYSLAKHVTLSPLSERKTRAAFTWGSPDFHKVATKSVMGNKQDGGYNCLVRGSQDIGVELRPSKQSVQSTGNGGGNSCDNSEYFELEPIAGVS
ncbi:uncharacterized protein LOC112575579 isoform X2 [Pomacea canaliculata]|uniref:uncharacterized protein LOC112575579 isoform X2 n=1 Tax=Pomacea canaliculata TaxID=400727 RepID=UPI000D728771|nr:uncharacterized protein LOC112575579 isoform X2 [Pomacea canaliculata]